MIFGPPHPGPAPSVPSRRRPARHGVLAALAMLTALAVPAAAQTPSPSTAPAAAPVPAAAASLPAPAASGPGTTPPPYTLPDLVRMTRDGSAMLAAERARINAAESAVVSARALPNPEVEVLMGRLGARQPGVNTGSAGTVSVTQPIELPGLRRARREEATASLDGTRSAVGAATLDVLAEVKLRYYQVLRRDAEWRAAQEDLTLANDIRERVRARVEAGEAPRYELIRADTERLNALRLVQTAQLRIDQSRAELRRLVGPLLPETFVVDGSLQDPLPPQAAIERVREDLLASHPQLVAARADVRAAEARVELERNRRLPTVAVRGTHDREPDSRITRAGVVMTLPLFDRRAGPIGEAEAAALRARAALADRELQLTQALSVAVQQYEISNGQVSAFETGIVREAENALRVAQAAYRYGERGILDFLDAQRSLRQARNELNAARYDRWAALVELERLRAVQP